MKNSSKLPSSLSVLQNYDSEESEDDEINFHSSFKYDKKDATGGGGSYVSDDDSRTAFDTNVTKEEIQRKRKRPRLDSKEEIQNISQVVGFNCVGRNNNLENTLVSSSSADSLKPCLPVPENILGMFSNKSSNSEDEAHNDPSSHKGRIRSFPHVRGNWASFIYLPCSYSTSDDDHVLSQLQNLINDVGATYDQNKIHPVPDKHLTLSRTLAFRHHWIDSFANSLRCAIKALQSISLLLEGFEVYTNEEKTRTFIGMRVMSTEDLLNLVKVCDKCLAEYELPSYYEDPSFHISCGWMLGDTRKWAEDIILPFINKKWEELIESDAEIQLLTIDHAEFKTGNKVYQLSFRRKTDYE